MRIFRTLSVLAFLTAFCISAVDTVFHVVRLAVEPVVQVFREVMSKPMAFIARLDLPSPMSFLQGHLKPEYRESWRTHGLSLAT